MLERRVILNSSRWSKLNPDGVGILGFDAAIEGVTVVGHGVQGRGEYEIRVAAQTYAAGPTSVLSENPDLGRFSTPVIVSSFDVLSVTCRHAAEIELHLRGLFDPDMDVYGFCEVRGLRLA